MSEDGLVDLASERLGGAVLAANDEFFAPKENLVKAAEPFWRGGVYTDRGKWMDGWETRRRRTPGHDWCVLRLGAAGLIRRVVVDTTHFRGNHPESCSLEGCALEGDPDEAQLRHPSTRWMEILPRSPLRGDSRNVFEVESVHRFTHLRLNIHPDGGVARLRVLGEVLPHPALLAGEGVDLVAVHHGGRVEGCSDDFFSRPLNLLLPGPPENMGDGWETRRRRGPGHDWVIVRLGAEGLVRELLVDTTHFKGNHPASCSLEGAAEGAAWEDLLPEVELGPNRLHRFPVEIQRSVARIRFNIHPDGGVARLRVLGQVASPGWCRLGTAWINALLPEAAREGFLACCGSPAWASRMEEARPFASWEALLEVAGRLWWELGEEDWREAFAAHPEIGGEKDDQPDRERQWSAGEQAGTAAADRAVLEELAELNRRYRERFGYIFIIFATGKAAPEVLEELRRRLDNDPAEELKEAAGEQLRITRLRLARLAGMPESEAVDQTGGP